MRRYLLDTGPLAALLHGRPWAAPRLTPWVAAQETATSILVYGEVEEYIKGSPDYARHHAGLHALLGAVRPYFLTYPILERYADLRRAMRPSNSLIGDVDTLIAATALERRLTVVTTDKDYLTVPGLAVHLLSR